VTSSPDVETRAARIPERTAGVRFASWPFAHPTMLAPMEGVTHPMFRALTAERGGVGVVCTEFVRISRAPLSVAALRREVVKAPGVPLSVQVMGKDAEKMAEAAGVVAESGADVVDVNLGCPMPRVVKKGVGAAMLRDPELLYDVLSKMRARVPGMLSAKIRAGFDDKRSVVAIARVVEKAGADFIVVHPRRRADFYRGVADWRIVRVLKEALRIPVVGNGDVWYAADVLRMQRETGCDAVMLGRPALRNPWIFQQAYDLRRGVTPHDPSGEELVAHLARVRGRYETTYRKSVGKMKELVRYVGRAIRDERAFMTEALRASTTDEILTIADRHLGHLPAKALDLDAHGKLRLERSGSARAGDEEERASAA
jgi:nifR3 family TIM-barrel protein